MAGINWENTKEVKAAAKSKLIESGGWGLRSLATAWVMLSGVYFEQGILDKSWDGPAWTLWGLVVAVFGILKTFTFLRLVLFVLVLWFVGEEKSEKPDKKPDQDKSNEELKFIAEDQERLNEELKLFMEERERLNEEVDKHSEEWVKRDEECGKRVDANSVKKESENNLKEEKGND